MRRQESSPELLASAGGTPLYTAPEVMLAMFQSRVMADVVGHKNDVWALALMAVEVLTGHHPFSKDPNVLYSIAHHACVKLPSHLSKDCADFLAAALDRDPCLRPTAEELLQHPWMTGSLDRSKSICGVGLGTDCLVSDGLLLGPPSPNGNFRRCATTANLFMGSSPPFSCKGAGNERNFGGVVMSADCWEY